MKGKGFLKVIGILMIIGGGISIIIGILALVGASALAAVLGSIGLWYVATFLVLAGAALELAAGIVGVKNCDKPEKANVCIVMGILVAVFSILGNILSSVAGSDFNVFSMLSGLLLPILYIAGAVMNKQSQ